MSISFQDLIPGILTCLPVTGLLRFRCLSKAFCHKIDSAAFRKAHLELSNRTKTPRQLIFLDQDGEISAIDFAGELSTPTKVGNPSEFKQGYSNRTLYHGSCNGLLLLSSSSSDKFSKQYGLWLWNPFTRESNKLPDCPGITSDELCNSKFGFGCDPFSNDYKVVQIHKYWEIDPTEVFYKICVFSLRSNTWRELPLTIPSETLKKGMSWDAVFLDGVLHWLVHLHEIGSDSESIEIVSFDISTEQFVYLMPAIPPFSEVYVNKSEISLEVLKGGLVYCQRVCRRRNSQHVELSRAVKNGEQIAWTKLYSLDLSCLEWGHSRFKIFWESKAGNKILLQTNEGSFFWYDLKARTLERVNNIPRMPQGLNYRGFFNFERASICCDSFVSPY